VGLLPEVGFLSTDRIPTTEGTSTISGLSDIDGISTIDGFSTTGGAFCQGGSLPLVGFLGVGRLYYSWWFFCLNETNQEKGYKYAKFGRCHSFSSSSNLTCKGLTIAGEGLVELTS